MTFDAEVEELNRKKFEEMMRRKASDQTRPKSDDSGKPMVLTDSTFSSAVSKYPVMVVDFWAAWCGPCRMVAPIIDELANEYAGRVAFGKVNVDENPMTSQVFGIQSIPTMLVFRNGQPVDGLVGAVPKSQIEKKIAPYLQDASSPAYR